MKGIKLEDNVTGILFIEDKDRFVHLEGEQSAVVIDEDPKLEGGMRLSVFYPEPEENKEEMPFSVMVCLCIQEFLDDGQWVLSAKERVQARLKAKAEEKEANKEA